MQVFKAFFKVLKKKLPSAMIYLWVFLLISIIMISSSSSESQFEATRLKVCIFDEDNTAASQALAAYISDSHDIVELENDEDEILDALYYFRANYVLTIKEGYSDKLSAGITDGLFTNYHVHDNYDAVFMNNMLDEYVRTVSAYTASGKDISESVAAAKDVLSHETKVTLTSFDENNSSSASEMSSQYSMYFQYLPYMFISVMIAALCPVLMTMNRKEIRDRTNCSCVKPSSDTLQIMLGSAVFITGIWLVFMIAGAVLSGGIYSGKGWLSVLNSFVFTLIAADIAIIVSSFDISDTAVNIINQVLGLGMSFLCGVFVPLSLLGDGVIAAARFLPAYWYVRANNMIFDIEAYDQDSVTKFIAIEAIYAVILAIAALIVRRQKYSGSTVKTGRVKTAS